MYLLLPSLSIYLIRMVISKVYRYSRIILKSYYTITKNNLIQSNMFYVFLFVINWLLIYFYQIVYKMYLSYITSFNSNYTKSENNFEWHLGKNIRKYYLCITISACMQLGKCILVHYFVIQTIPFLINCFLNQDNLFLNLTFFSCFVNLKCKLKHIIVYILSTITLKTCLLLI